MCFECLIVDIAQSEDVLLRVKWIASIVRPDSYLSLPAIERVFLLDLGDFLHLLLKLTIEGLLVRHQGYDALVYISTIPRRSTI